MNNKYKIKKYAELSAVIEEMGHTISLRIFGYRGFDSPPYIGNK